MSTYDPLEVRKRGTPKAHSDRGGVGSGNGNWRGIRRSTPVTPLYAIYKEQFGFSQITLTLVHAAYGVGNLAALLFFGRVSDEVGRDVKPG